MNRRMLLLSYVFVAMLGVAAFSAGYLLSSSSTRYVKAGGTITVYKDGKLLYTQPDAITPYFNDYVACRLFTTNSSTPCYDFYNGNFFSTTGNNTINSFAAGLQISTDTTPYPTIGGCISTVTTITPVAPALAGAQPGVIVMAVAPYPAHTPSIILNATVSATSSFTAAKVCLSVLTLVKNSPSGYYLTGLVAVDLLTSPVSLTSGQTITVVWTWSW